MEDSIGMALKHYTDTCRDVTAIWFTNAYLHYIVLEKSMFQGIFLASVSSIFGIIIFL